MLSKLQIMGLIGLVLLGLLFCISIGRESAPPEMTYKMGLGSGMFIVEISESRNLAFIHFTAERSSIDFELGLIVSALKSINAIGYYIVDVSYTAGDSWIYDPIIVVVQEKASIIEISPLKPALPLKPKVGYVSIKKL